MRCTRVMVVALMLATGDRALAKPVPDAADGCAARKLVGGANTANSLLACEAKGVAKGLPASAECTANADAMFARVALRTERRGGCLFTDDTAAVLDVVHDYVTVAATTLDPSTGASRCAAAKLKALGRRARTVARARAADTLAPDRPVLESAVSKADGKLQAAFLRAETLGDCIATGDATALTATENVFVDALRDVLLPPLRTLALATGREIGGTAIAAPLANEAHYAETLAHEFNHVTTDYETLWILLHYTADTYDFTNADAIVAFAEANGMTVRGNQLIWHAFLPPYLSTLGPAELQAEMESYIRTVLGHFRGHVSSWVVVNEAVNFGGAGLRNSLWLQQLGPGYIADAFRIAHDADPDAELLYSDVLADGINHTSDYIYTMLQDLLVQGVPVHGIALQMHLGDGFGPAPDSIIENMQCFAALGLNVHVSEMDVQIAGLPGVDTAAKLQAQRNVYYTVVGNCIVVPGCRSITFWGFTDNHSWLGAGGFSDMLPLPFDTQYQPKPAYRGVRNALAGH